MAKEIAEICPLFFASFHFQFDDFLLPNFSFLTVPFSFCFEIFFLSFFLSWRFLVWFTHPIIFSLLFGVLRDLHFQLLLPQQTQR
ncbi:hypothetical protein V6Z12_D05G297700 [Gossypium hirsutum]